MSDSSSTSTTVKVPLGTFARSGLEAHFGADVEQGMQAATRHYARRLRSGISPAGIPRRYPPLDGSDPATHVCVDLSADVKAQLEREAGRQGASLQQLLRHAALVYLADLDSPLSPARLA